MAKVQNRERLLAKLAAIPPKMREAMSTAMQQGADEITRLQKNLAPQKSGALRNSIRNVKGSYTPDNANVRGVGGGGGEGDPELTIHLVAGDATAYYAAFVEFGTAPHAQGGKFAGTEHPGTRPRPFFYPAYRSLKRRYRARLTRATKKAIKAGAGS
ncbi:MAG TPA: HK97-gp10 family putative phage morphogenesis protein [Microvirga sp.]|jgi:HK97 gp10 family phage protein|nr:HK97-gp10 family putative phage morphogenesis protein [Microvirga sp.]